jgi:hypothetical protein
MEGRSEVKQMVIEHYERMIAWAKTQNPIDYCSFRNMETALDESWSGVYCLLCNFYKDCPLCPVGKRTGKFNCNETPWQLLNRAQNWEEWLLAAEEELKFLEGLDF